MAKSSPKYTPKEYRIYLNNSSQKHILVEGKNDKYFLERMLSYLANEIDKPELTEQVVVDSAASLIESESGTGSNKEKVEEIANSVVDKPYSQRFIAFIDRELYLFDWDYEQTQILQDNFPRHNIEKRIIRTRGHSLENYLFEVDIVSNFFNLNTTIPNPQIATNLFKQIFKSVIYSACTIGLAATKSSLLQKIESGILWRNFIELTSGEINFLLEDWLDFLIDKRSVSNSKISEIKHNYKTYIQLINQTSFEIVRWLSHGHIGYDFLKEAYIKCVMQISKEAESNVNWAKKDKMLQQLINYCVEEILSNDRMYFQEIFEMLDLSRD
ncbi:MAG: DUF4435 domain-containing protein [Okeania sp. SIO3I5]|uniref:DUF4435 domain-containing protein n=1 Tax=Okeania sp. SIO3I5 TaxID=2607805 RepID=UPI0013B7FE01|nr:DUF4435 domain-containing protein [Okeania sp. SIO3I5]NEQ36247.1 DUF4435 domain-containing protein [Okeania sp. SIO3I5]